jgi:hypothetical protein
MPLYFKPAMNQNVCSGGAASHPGDAGLMTSRDRRRFLTPMLLGEKS